MTLLGIQQRFRECGRIRLGERRTTAAGKSYPSRLETFRLTSSDRSAIDAAAARYGGTVEKWESGWQVTTESDRLDVMLPPSGAVEPYSLHYELWSGGGIQRRCDGRDAIIGGADGLCVCDPEARECAPTLRVSFLLPDLPGLGTWRLETKGYAAAAELPGALNLLSTWAEAGRPVRAILRLEQRSVKRDGQTRLFAVPVLDPVGTINTMLAPPRLALVTQDDDLPLLPHEIDSSSEAAPVGDPEAGVSTPPPSSDDDLPDPPIDPPDAGVREDPGALGVSSSDGAGVGGATPAPVTTEPSGATLASDVTDEPPMDIQARYAWAERLGWESLPLDEGAVAATGMTVMEMDSGTWRAFALALKAGALDTTPPKPGSDRYRRLAPQDKAASRAWWQGHAKEGAR